MSAEAAVILREALVGEPPLRALGLPTTNDGAPIDSPIQDKGLGTAIHERFKGLALRIVDPPGRRARNEALIFLFDEDGEIPDEVDELPITAAGGEGVASLTIRNLDDELKRKLRIRAAEHGCSMEQEARDILWATLNGTAPPRDLYAAIRACVAPVGGLELELPPMEDVGEPPKFE